MAKQLNVNLAFTADTGKAKTQIQELQNLLSQITYSGATSKIGDKISIDLQKASTAAKELQFHLNNAFNTTTGKFDLSLLDRSLKTSGANITQLSTQLLGAGATGQQAFLKLAQSISLADQPMLRVSNRMREFGTVMKNTIKWQLSSSMIHGFMGAINSAYGYAQDLNKSLTDIRIVTGDSADEMARFAEQANKTAKALSTTTNDYAKASLIYFQQGLDDAEVQKRTDVTIKMANATGTSAQTVSDQMTAIWNNFDDGSKSLEYYADVMTALGAATASSTDEISQGLQKFAAVAETVGLSYEYATAALTAIMSNTRESADVVGTALKTLFARIQGLQLGETLEDGTTLNKYSEALSKVGISIYESNGELKAMDNILNEMAAKWDTLGNAEQTALAQTVAGVRQYTQLIALMENWDNGDADSFQANLKTISGAEGTLDEQAEIYAQSWEAAEKRVRTSAEGIYQSLLDDKFFISLNNGFANVLTGIDSFIDGLGGVKPLITGIASIFISNFAHKIPQVLDNLKYNLQILTKSTKDVYDKMASEIYKVSNTQFQVYRDTGGKSGINEDSSLGVALKQANDLTAARTKLALATDKMSESERQMANTSLSIIQQTQDEVLALTKKKEVLEKNIELQMKAAQSSAGYFNSYDLGEAQSHKLENKVDTDVLGLQNFDGISNLGGSIAANLSQNLFQVIDEANNKARSVGTTWEQVANTTNEKIISIKTSLGTEFSTAVENIKNKLQSVNQEDFDNVKKQLLNFLQVLPSGVRDIEAIQKVLNNLRNSKGPAELMKNFEALDNVLKGIRPNLTHSEKILSSIHGDKIHTLVGSMKDYNSTINEANSKTNILKTMLNEFQPTHVVRMSEAFGALGGLMGNVATIGRSVISIFDALSNPNLSGWEKFSTVLMSISMIIPGVLSMLRNIATLRSFCTTLINQENAALTQQAILQSLNTAAASTAYKSRVTDIQKVLVAMSAENKEKMASILADGALAASTGKLTQAKKEELIAQLASIIAGEKEVNTSHKEIAAKILEAHANKAVETTLWGIAKARLAAMPLSAKIILAVVAVIVAAIALVVGHQKKMAEQTKENAEAAREMAKATKEQADSNQELVDSYNAAFETYNKVKEAFDQGKATTEDLTNAQENLAKSALETAKALGIQGSAWATLSGNYEQLTQDIIKKQKENIQKGIQDEEKARNATGEEFILNMREGKGYNSGGIYSADFFGGLNKKDETFFKNVDYSQFDYLHSYGNGEFYLSSGQDLQSMMAAYEEAQELYNQALSTMTAEEMNKSEVFQHLKNWLEKSKKSYEAYKAAEDNIQNYQIRSASLSSYAGISNAYKIDSIENYDAYSKAMIESIGKERGILDENGEIIAGQEQAYKDLTEAVYAYLGSLEGVSDFVTKSKAFDEIAEQTGMAREELLNIYNNLKTEEEKELFFKISFNRVNSKEELEKELVFLQSVADGNKIKVQLDVITEGLDVLKDGATTEEIAAWAKKMAEAYGEAFNLEEYLALSPEKQQEYLQRLKNEAKANKAANREDQIDEYKAAKERAQEEQVEKKDEYEAAVAANATHTENLNKYQEIKAAYNQAVSNGTANKFDWSKYNDLGIGSLNDLNNKITNTETEIAANQKIIDSYNALGEAINTYDTEIKNLETEKQIEDAYGWRDALQEQAKASDIAYDEVQEYARILRESNKNLEGNIKLSEKMALQYLRSQKGVKKMSDSFDDWADAIKNGNKDIIKYSKAMDEIRDAYKDVFNTINPELIEGLSNEFLSSSKMMGLMEKALAGDEQAWNDWEAAVLEQINNTAPAFANMTEEMKAKMTELTTMAANLDFSGLTPGADIKDAAFLAKLSQMEFATAAAAAVMSDNLSSVGVDAEIVEHKRKVPGYRTTVRQNGGFWITPPGGEPIYNAITSEIEQVHDPHEETYYTLEGAKYNGKGTRPSTDSAKSGGGGGGGGSKKSPEKKSSTDKSRYHTIQNQLEDLKSEYEDISEAAEKAFGEDKLDAIDKQIKKNEELIASQEKLLGTYGDVSLEGLDLDNFSNFENLRQNLKFDKAKMEAYFKDLMGTGITFEYDEKGNISNFRQIEDYMHAQYNKNTTALGEEDWETFEKKYQKLEEYIEQYEETYDELRDAEQEYQDLLNKRLELQMAKLQYKVELELAVPEDEIAVIEYQLGRIEDDAYKSAKTVQLLTTQAEAIYDQIQINKQGLNDIIKLSKDYNNGALTEEQADLIKEYRDNLLNLNEQFDDIRATIEEKVMETFDSFNEKLQTSVDVFDHYNNILENYKNIVDIVGEDRLGISDQFMNDLNQASIDNAIEQLKATDTAMKVIQEAQAQAENALAEAKARGDEASQKMWEETLSSLNEEAQSAQEEMLSAWENALDAIAETFEVTVERVVKTFNDSIYALGGLEGLQDDFSRQQENADIMLDDYQKIYELSKLSRDINKTIDDTDIIGGKQKLKKLLGEINKLQEDGVEMSQYDLEYLQKTYDLRLAELELEEAQRAKNTVRLSRDNEGNWSYIYTQNTDAVDAAQQKYEDALYAMQDLSSNYIDEMSEQLISTSQEMAEALAAIRIQDYANIEDYYAEVERVQSQYQEELAMQEEELQKAIDNNKVLYDTDWTNYHNATGYKISDTELFATTFRDTLLGALMGSEEDSANFTDIMKVAVSDLTNNLMAGAEIYYTNLENVMNAAGTSTGDFAEDTAANIDAVVEKSKEGAAAVDQMAIEMQTAMENIMDSVTNWQEAYGMAMENIIQSNLEVIESFNQMLAALSIDADSITVKYDIADSAGGQAQQFDTGGYTGEWGKNGKLAVLHEKELILKPEDTSNFLTAVQITRAMLETIDLNAKQASFGLGNLVPSTIRDDNNQTLEQQVHIVAEFPNVNDHNEIEQAFNNLINTASQYANRK